MDQNEQLKNEFERELKRHWRWDNEQQDLLDAVSLVREEGVWILMDQWWQKEQEKWIGEVMRGWDEWSKDQQWGALERLKAANQKDPYRFSAEGWSNEQENARWTQKEVKQFDGLWDVWDINIEYWDEMEDLRMIWEDFGLKKKRQGILKILPRNEDFCSQEDWIKWSDWVLNLEKEGHEEVLELFAQPLDLKGKWGLKKQDQWLKQIEKSKQWRRIPIKEQEKLRKELKIMWSNLEQKFIKESVEELGLKGETNAEYDQRCGWMNRVFGKGAPKRNQEVKKRVAAFQREGILKVQESWNLKEIKRGLEVIKRVFQYGPKSQSRGKMAAVWIQKSGGINLWKWLGNAHYENYKKEFQWPMKKGWAWPIPFEESMVQEWNARRLKRDVSEVEREIQKYYEEYVKDWIEHRKREPWKSLCFGEVYIPSEKSEYELRGTLKSNSKDWEIMKNLWGEVFERQPNKSELIRRAGESFNEITKILEQEEKSPIYNLIRAYGWEYSIEFWREVQNGLWGIEKEKWIEAWLEGVATEQKMGSVNQKFGWRQGVFKEVEDHKEMWFESKREIWRWMETIESVPLKNSLRRRDCWWEDLQWTWSPTLEWKWEVLWSIELELEAWYTALCFTDRRRRNLEGRDCVRQEMKARLLDWKRDWERWLAQERDSNDKNDDQKIEMIEIWKITESTFEILAGYEWKKTCEQACENWIKETSLKSRQQWLDRLRIEAKSKVENQKRKNLKEEKEEWGFLNTTFELTQEELRGYREYRKGARWYETLESWIVEKSLGQDPIKLEDWMAWIECMENQEVSEIEGALKECERIVKKGEVSWSSKELGFLAWREAEKLRLNFQNTNQSVESIKVRKGSRL